MENNTSITARLTKAPKENGTVLLRRTYNQSDFNGGVIKYWRVVGPIGHPNLNSDLSLEGLKDWGILKWF